MSTGSIQAAVGRSIFWFSAHERSRRRDLKTLAALQSRSLSTRSEIALMDARAAHGVSQLVEQRTTLDRAQQAVHDSERELQTLVAQISAIGGPRSV